MVITGEVMITSDTRDYLITAADLVLSGTTVLPESGDVITETLGDVTATFVVTLAHNSDGMHRAWEWVDRDRRTILVRTKQVATPEPEEEE
jgi:hypothetical protein